MNNFQPPIPMYDIYYCGVTLDQAQSLNYERAKAMIQVEKIRAIKEVNQAFNGLSCLTEATGNMVSLDTSGKIDIYNLVSSIFSELKVVKDRAPKTGKHIYNYYKYDNDLKHHVLVTKNDLEADVNEILLERLQDKLESIPEVRINAAVKQTMHKTPLVSNSALEILGDTQVMFTNGCYDFTTNVFIPYPKCSNIFTRFVLPYNFEENTAEPVVFNKMLADMMDNNPTKVQLAYEIIGGILSNKNTMKKILLFQGKSHGGKTRLSDIIALLLDMDDIVDCNTFTDITKDALKNECQDYKLAFIRDASQHKLGGKQVSFLKSFADGSRTNKTAFKVLANTNYAVYSENDGSISEALKNRLLVLPFTKAMDNTDSEVICFEDEFFAKERIAIVKKALSAFGEVIKRKAFCANYPLNEVLDDTAEGISGHNDIKDIIKATFLLSDPKECTLSTDEIMSIMKEKAPNEVSNKQALLKHFKKAFPELKSERKGDVNFYNLKLK